MAEFTYEVVASYAEKENLKIQSISFNKRDPKFDIRHWMTRDGKEVMGKGVTLTLEELLWVSEELNKIVKSIGGGTPVEIEEDETEEVEETQEPDEMESLMEYVVASAKKIAPKDEAIHGVVVKDGASYATNREVIIKANKVVNLDTVDDNEKLRAIADMMESQGENLKAISKTDINKFVKECKKLKGNAKYNYCFGEGKPTVNARYLARAIEAIKGTVRYAANGVLSVIGDNGMAIILPVKSAGKTVGLIKA